MKKNVFKSGLIATALLIAFGYTACFDDFDYDSSSGQYPIGVASMLRRTESKRPRLQQNEAGGAVEYISMGKATLCSMSGNMLLTRRSVDATPNGGVVRFYFESYSFLIINSKNSL
jgi:hypothetical protein